MASIDSFSVTLSRSVSNADLEAIISVSLVTVFSQVDQVVLASSVGIS